MSRHPPFAMPADIIVGESIDAYTKRKNASLVENRIKQEWLADAHPELPQLLFAWVMSPMGGERVLAWEAVERYLVANLKDTPA